MKLLAIGLLILLVGFAGNSHGQDIRTITYPNGDVYVGEFRDGQPNGQGTHTFGRGDYEGDVYVGEFRDGFYPDLTVTSEETTLIA